MEGAIARSKVLRSRTEELTRLIKVSTSLFQRMARDITSRYCHKLL